MFRHALFVVLAVLALVFPVSRRIVLETLRNVVTPIIAVLWFMALRLP
jgi:hypothetical protein